MNRSLVLFTRVMLMYCVVELNTRITTLRNMLHIELASSNGIISDKALTISRVLDKLIVKHMRLTAHSCDDIELSCLTAEG